MGFLCVQICVSQHLYVFLLLFWLFSSFFVCFILYGLLFLLFAFLFSCFRHMFSNKQDIKRVRIWLDKWRDLEGIGVGESIIKIFCMK